MAWKNANLFNTLILLANSLKSYGVHLNAYKWPETWGVGRFNVDERRKISSVPLFLKIRKKEASAMFEKVAGYNSGKSNRSINYRRCWH